MTQGITSPVTQGVTSPATQGVTSSVTQGVTRRAILMSGLPAAWGAVVNPPAKKSKPLPAVGEFARFVDPTTESTIVRLTNPGAASYLPAPSNRFISVRERFLVFTSDRTGVPTPFYLDLRTGALRAITATSKLHPRSLCLDAPGRSLFLIDGTDLKQIAIAGKKVDVLAQGVSAFSLGNSASQLMVVREGRLEQLHGKAELLAEDVADWCAVRPGGKGCAFARAVSSEEQEFWYVPFSDGSPPEGSAARPALLAKGTISNPLWSPDGRSLLFLRQTPGNGVFISEIHETFPESSVEQRVTPTSQFAAFSANGDGSVFVGASSSKAQPTIILLLRSVQREFTLCEHRATHPMSVNPVFSPDSRRVYFESDHQGKSALYSVNTELLVEPTPAAAL